EAKAFNLGEVAPGNLRRHVEDGLSGYGGRRVVGRLEESERRLADLHVDVVLIRREAPRQRAVDIGVEADADDAVEDSIRGLGSAAGLAGIARRLTEQAIKRHGGKGEAQHAGRDAGHRERRQPATGVPLLRVLLLPAHDVSTAQIGRSATWPPSLTMVTMKNSTTRPNKTQAIASDRLRWRRLRSLSASCITTSKEEEATCQRRKRARRAARQTAGRDKAPNRRTDPLLRARPSPLPARDSRHKRARRTERRG